MAWPLLLASLGLLVLGSSDSAVMTQTPAYQQVEPGGTFTISCTASIYVGILVNWYVQKPGKVPKLLIQKANIRQPGVPARVSAEGYRTDFSMTVAGVQREDAGVYYCQQGHATLNHDDTPPHKNLLQLQVAHTTQQRHLQPKPQGY